MRCIRPAVDPFRKPYRREERHRTEHAGQRFDVEVGLFPGQGKGAGRMSCAWLVDKESKRAKRVIALDANIILAKNLRVFDTTGKHERLVTLFHL